MTDASAIPPHLYTYSNRCTHGAQELQDWVRTVLTPTMTSYEMGGGECLAIASEVATEVARAYYTDRDVRTVGQAFERAGRADPGMGRPYVASDRAVDEAFRALQLAGQHRQEMNAGAALAHRMTTNVTFASVTGDEADSVREITRLLAAHADDRYFCAGFYNSLSAEQIVLLMARGHNDQALASAYASGALTAETQQDVVHALTWVESTPGMSSSHWNLTAAMQLKVIGDLTANTQAAIDFGRLLTSEQATALFGTVPMRAPGDYSTQTAFLRLLTVAAANAHSAAEARDLLHRVSPAFAGTPSALELKAVLPALTTFLAVAGHHLISTRPPALTGKEATDDSRIDEWAASSGANLGWLRPYIDWVERGDEAAKEQRERMAGGLGEFAIDVVADVVLDSLLPESAGMAGKAFNVGVHGLVGTAMVKEFEPRIAQMLSEGKNEELDAELARLVSREVGPGASPSDVLNEVMWQKSRVLTTVMVFQHYHVYQHGKRVTLASALGTPEGGSGSGTVSDRVLERINDKDGRWARSIEIRDKHGHHVLNLSDVLANLADRAHGAPTFENAE